VAARVAATAVSHDRFHAALEGLGAFPSPRRARVLWVGVTDDAERLPALARDLNVALEAFEPPEDRPFVPHLTLARFDHPVSVAETLASTSWERQAFEVKELVLYRSHLGKPAARYEPLATFALPGG
jgi:2'-5' RNA ligase